MARPGKEKGPGKSRPLGCAALRARLRVPVDARTDLLDRDRRLLRADRRARRSLQVDAADEDGGRLGVAPSARFVHPPGNLLSGVQSGHPPPRAAAPPEGPPPRDGAK